jgi:DNA-binding transcriptional MerR regulator
MHVEDERKGITEVAKLLGISQRTLRFYEDKGLVVPCRIGQLRAYRPSQIARMRLVLRAKLLGFLLRDIPKFLELYDAEPRNDEELRSRAARCREQIASFEKQRVALDRTVAELVAIENEATARIASAAKPQVRRLAAAGAA